MLHSDIITFVLKNEESNLVEADLTGFDPLKELKIEDYEIIHSNVLSWLLDPKGTHDFSDVILKRLLLNIFSKSENKTLHTQKLHKLKLRDIIIYKDFDNIDLVLVSKKNNLVIYIENKITASTFEKQHNNYWDELQVKFPDYDIVSIYLTLNGEIPDSRQYLNASYGDLIKSLKFVTKNYPDRTSPENVTFISYYVYVLKEKFYRDAELKWTYDVICS